MMLQIGDEGVVSAVNEDDLIYVDKNELDELVDRYNRLKEEHEQLKRTLSVYSDATRNDVREIKELMQDIEEIQKENEKLKCGNKNLKATLNDFINICNRLQSNPTDKQTLSVARDMLQNMGKELEE